MSTPKRIQQRRTKGWRKPEGAVAVGRGTKWGNPYRVSNPVVGEYIVTTPLTPAVQALVGVHNTRRAATEHAIDLFRTDVGPSLPVDELVGKDLMCWCPLEDDDGNRFPCHADVLLELANGTPENKED